MAKPDQVRTRSKRGISAQLISTQHFRALILPLDPRSILLFSDILEIPVAVIFEKQSCSLRLLKTCTEELSCKDFDCFRPQEFFQMKVVTALMGEVCLLLAMFVAGLSVQPCCSLEFY